MGGEDGEEPGCGIQAGPDLVLLQVAVEVPVVVMEEPGQLVHLDLCEKGGGVRQEQSTAPP